MQRVIAGFVGLSLVLLVIFFGALMYSAFGMEMKLPEKAGTIELSEVRSTPPFDEPGVHRVGENRYEVVVIGRAWSFIPDEIRVPAGAELTFKATSEDALHGFYIEGTRVNMMLVPGEISEMTYTFDEPGEHLLICHEYCGLGHHMMYGKVIVE